MIEINNSNPNNKPFYYHLVEENQLLLFMKKYLPKCTNHVQNDGKVVIKEVVAVAQVTFIVSIPSHKETFLENYNYQQNILNHYTDSW